MTRLALLILMSATIITNCKSRNTSSEAKGLYADASEGYLHSEDQSIVIYPHYFNDANLPSQTTIVEGNVLPVPNAVCLYVKRFNQETNIVNESIQKELFKTAGSATTHAINNVALYKSIESVSDAIKSIFTFKKYDGDIGNEVAYFHKVVDPSNISKTSAGIRSMLSYVETAKKFEDKKTDPCPEFHPLSK